MSVKDDGWLVNETKSHPFMTLMRGGPLRQNLKLNEMIHGSDLRFMIEERIFHFLINFFDARRKEGKNE